MSVQSPCELLRSSYFGLDLFLDESAVSPRSSIIIFVMFCRSELDTDDEVRDRATFYRSVLEAQQKALNSAYILNGKFQWLFCERGLMYNFDTV